MSEIRTETVPLVDGSELAAHGRRAGRVGPGRDRRAARRAGDHRFRAGSRAGLRGRRVARRRPAPLPPRRRRRGRPRTTPRSRAGGSTATRWSPTPTPRSAGSPSGRSRPTAWGSSGSTSAARSRSSSRPRARSGRPSPWATRCRRRASSRWSPTRQGLTCPWLGIYGTDEPEVDRLRTAVSASEVATDVVVYPSDGGHRFDDDPDNAAEAWQRTLNWFDAHLR